jgi:hypothetical protein
MSSMIAVWANVSAFAAACYGAVWYRRWRTRRAFDAEYARLVAQTAVDLAVLHGPGPNITAAAAAADADLTARPLTDADLEYYASCWEHIESEFGEAPAIALDLAEHLTANLLLTRGLTPGDSPQPSALPEAWAFPSARGYREAQALCARVQDTGAPGPQLPTSRLRSALSLYRAFFEEILALPATRESEI